MGKAETKKARRFRSIVSEKSTLEAPNDGMNIIDFITGEKTTEPVERKIKPKRNLKDIKRNDLENSSRPAFKAKIQRKKKLIDKIKSYSLPLSYVEKKKRSNIELAKKKNKSINFFTSMDKELLSALDNDAEKGTSNKLSNATMKKTNTSSSLLDFLDSEQRADNEATDTTTAIEELSNIKYLKSLEKIEKKREHQRKVNEILAKGKSNNSKKALVSNESNRLKMVLQDSSFKQDGFSAIQEYLRNSLGQGKVTSSP